MSSTNNKPKEDTDYNIESCLSNIAAEHLILMVLQAFLLVLLSHALELFQKLVCVNRIVVVVGDCALVVWLSS